MERVGPDMAEALLRSERCLAASGIEAHALRAGDRAPDFALPDQHGRSVSLSGELAHGPAVLLFVRGGWCPFCSLTLRAYQEAMPALRRAGARVLALTPQQSRLCSDTADRDMLDFPLLSDRGLDVAASYGVVHELDEALRPFYLRLGHDLPRINGCGDWRVPLPATFVVGRDGRIALAHVEAATHRRLEPDAALEAIHLMGLAA